MSVARSLDQLNKEFSVDTVRLDNAEVSISKKIESVPNFTALQSIDFETITHINLKELHPGIPKSGGDFVYYPTVDKSTANPGTIIDPSVSLDFQGTGVGLGCWVRQYNGAVNVKWFGASEATNITEFVQAALGVSNNVLIDTNASFSQITLVDSQTLTINSELTTTATNAIYLNSLFGAHVIFGSMGKITGDATTDTQSCITMSDCVNCKVLYPFIEGFLNKGISITGSSNNNEIVKPKVRGATGSGGAGVSLHGSNVVFNRIEYPDVSFNRIGVTINGSNYNNVTHPIANECTASGVSIDGIITASGDGGKYNKIDHPICNSSTNASYGGIFCGNGSSFNEIIHPICNNNVGAGIRFSGGSGYTNESNKIIDPVCIGNGANGMTLSWCPEMEIVNPTVKDNTGIGIADSSCDGLKIRGGVVDNNTTDGILHQSPRTLDSGITVTNNGADGIEVAYGGALGLGDNRSESCHVAGNTGTDYKPAGGSKALNFTGFVTNSAGVDTKSDSQTIDHDLSGNPLRVVATGSVAGEIITVSTFTSTTFTVHIKQADGITAGTSQPVYWEASLY